MVRPSSVVIPSRPMEVPVTVLHEMTAPTLPCGGVLTGEHCPATGWWQMVQSEEDVGPIRHPRFIGQGSLMPASGEGVRVFWVPSHRSRRQSEY